MNPRIKELIEQCTDIVEIVNPDTDITHHREFFDQEKFALLIVRECAVPMITQARAMDAHGGYKNNPIEVTAMNLHQGLLKHFGVEE